MQLGAAGATVYATGRATQDRRSEMDRPETIGETAALVTEAGTLRLAVDSHVITSHFAIPLLIETPGGLVVEVTDGTDEYNAGRRDRLSLIHVAIHLRAISRTPRPRGCRRRCVA